MTSPRVVKIYEQLKENFKNLGYSLPAKMVQGMSSDADFFNGCQGLVIDFDAFTWATGNRRLVLLAVPAGFNEADAVKTQSHAAGHFIDGSVSFVAIFEAPVALTAASTATRLAYEKFVTDFTHILRGQQMAPVSLYFTENTVEPKVKGIDAQAASSAAFVKIGDLLPYGRTYPGGV